MKKLSLRRGALTLSAANTLDFALQFLLPIALVRLLPTSAFADYRLAWLAIGTALALAPFGLPRSLLYFVPRTEGRARAAYVHQSLLLLLCTGAAAGLLMGPWNPLLPASLRNMDSAHWFLPAFLTMWVAAQLTEILPTARGDLASQSRLIVGLGVLRVVMVVAAAFSGRADVVFATLVLYAAIKLLLALVDIGRQHGFAMLPLDRAALRTQLVYVLPLGLSNALFLLRGQADQWVAAVLFSAAVYAAFSIGTIMMQVNTLVRNSVTYAISPHLSRMEADKDQAGMLRLNQRANIASAVVLLPTLVAFAVLAEHIVAIVYTERYMLAADVIRVNALALAGVAVEVTTLNLALNQGRFMFKVDAMLLLVGIGAGVLGATLFGVPGAALGNVVTLAAGNAFGFWRVSRITGVPVRQLQQWPLLLRILLAALGAGALGWGFDRANLVTMQLPEALLIGLLVAAAYALMLRLTGALPDVLALFGRGPKAAAAAVQP